jgi:nitroreductase
MEDDISLTALCDSLIDSRQHFGPQHLAEPAPDELTLRLLFEAAAAAPDHRRLNPWRFLVLGPTGRGQLAQAFVQALLERDPSADAAAQAEAFSKAGRGPVLILAVARLDEGADEVPDSERWLSLGAAIQNLLLAAQARGFASGLSSGRALHSRALRQAFDLAPHERAACFISLGTPARSKARRPRPAVDEFVTWL